MLARLGPLPSTPVIADIGCSTGHLLEDLAARPSRTRADRGRPRRRPACARRIGSSPRALLLLADACELPLAGRERRRGRQRQPARACTRRRAAHCRRSRACCAPVRRRCSSFRRARARTTTTTASSGTSAATRRGELAEKARGAGLEVIRGHPPRQHPLPGVLAGQADATGEVRETARARRSRSASPRTSQATRDSRVGLSACRLEERLLASAASRCPSAFAASRWCGARRDTMSASRTAERPRRHGHPMLSIVIPAYNEEANIDRVYERMRAGARAARDWTGRSSSASTRRRTKPSS